MFTAADVLCRANPYTGEWLEKVGNITMLNHWKDIRGQENKIDKIVFNPEFNGFRTLTLTDKSGRGYYCSVERPHYEEVEKLVEDIQQLNDRGVN